MFRTGESWYELLPYALLAYRSTPHKSLGGFSPSEILLGKNLQGPLDLLKADWEGVVQSSSIPIADFVMKLQDRLLAVKDLAKENLLKSQAKQKYFQTL